MGQKEKREKEQLFHFYRFIERLLLVKKIPLEMIVRIKEEEEEEKKIFVYK